VVRGDGTLIMDGQKFSVQAGDVSLVERGHSHGIINADTGKMRLLVISA
jgi:quercetin dioxygenase-like cupin family protein